MNVRLLAALTLLPLAAVLLVSTALAGRGAESVSTAKLRGVNFVSACTFSHAAADDPIVFPGKPGASHHHSFVGNATTSASSTLETLLGGASTCHRPGDTAAYWMPTLLADGRPVMPNHAQIYYRRKTMRHVEAFPPGFRMIAGDARATSPQPLRVAFWNCGVGGGVKPTSTVPACPDADATRSASTSPSRAAGTARTSTAPRTRATSRTRSPDAARRSSPMRCRRSRSSTATRSPAARA